MSVNDLHKAALRGDVAEVRRLVAAGVGVNEVNAADKMTALHFAADNGHVEAVKTLVELNADIEAKTDQGATPLHFAAVNGHVEAAKTLLQLSVHLLQLERQRSLPLPQRSSLVLHGLGFGFGFGLGLAALTLGLGLGLARQKHGVWV